MSTNKDIKFSLILNGKVSPSAKQIKTDLKQISLDVDRLNKKKITPRIDPKATESFKKFGGMFKDLKSKLTGGGGLANITQEVGSNFGQFGNILSQVATKGGVVGATIAGVTAVIGGLGVAAFSAANKMKETLKTFRTIATGEQLDLLASKSKALEVTFGKSAEEIKDTVNTLSKEFGISLPQAIQKVSDAMVLTNGQLDLREIKEYSSQFRDLGQNADQFIGLLVQGKNEGIFNDKLPDMMKEFGLSIREMTKTQQDALSNAGFDWQKIQKDLTSGAISQNDLFKMIFKNIDKMDVSKAQTLIADLLKGAGEDVGKRGIKLFANMDSTGLEEQLKLSSQAVKKVSEKVKLEEELSAQQLVTANRLLPIMEKLDIMWLKVKIGFYSLMKFIPPLLKLITLPFQALYKAYEVLFTLIRKSFDDFINANKLLFNYLSDLFGKLFNFIKNGFISIFGEETFFKVKDFWEKTLGWIADKWKAFMDFLGVKSAVDLNVKSDNTTTPTFDKSESNLSGLSLADFTNNKDANSTLSDNIKNSVKGVTSEIKNITLNLGQLMNVAGDQIINNGGDVNNIQALLQQALLQVANDFNQVGGL